LKECLGARIRSALNSLMDDPQLVIEASHGEMAVDNHLVFELSQLLPDEGDIEGETGPSVDDAVHSEHPSEKEECPLTNDILGNLASLPGYRFSFVADTDGKRLALHSSDKEPDPENEVSWVTDWVKINVGHCSGGEFGCFAQLLSYIVQPIYILLGGQQIDHPFGGLNSSVAIVIDHRLSG